MNQVARSAIPPIRLTFAGIVAGPNKVMRRVARRDLITWDADARGYRMDPTDAEIVLQRWPAT